MTRASLASVSRPRSRAPAHPGRNRVTSTRAEPPIRRVDRASERPSERPTDRRNERPHDRTMDGTNDDALARRAVVSTAALARRRLARALDDTRTIVIVVDKTPGCGFGFCVHDDEKTRGWARDRVFHMSEHDVLFFLRVSYVIGDQSY